VLPTYEIMVEYGNVAHDMLLSSRPKYASTCLQTDVYKSVGKYGLSSKKSPSDVVTVDVGE